MTVLQRECKYVDKESKQGNTHTDTQKKKVNGYHFMGLSGQQAKKAKEKNRCTAFILDQTWLGNKK